MMSKKQTLIWTAWYWTLVEWW